MIAAGYQLDELSPWLVATSVEFVVPVPPQEQIRRASVQITVQ
jgi:hypothetical protein